MDPLPHLATPPPAYLLKASLVRENCNGVPATLVPTGLTGHVLVFCPHTALQALVILVPGSCFPPHPKSCHYLGCLSSPAKWPLQHLGFHLLSWDSFSSSLLSHTFIHASHLLYMHQIIYWTQLPLLACLLDFPINAILWLHRNLWPMISPFLIHLPSFLNWSIVDLQCCVSFWCTAKWFRYTYSFSYSFPLQFITGCWIYFPVLCSRTLLFIHSIYRSLHLLIPTSHSIPTLR